MAKHEKLMHIHKLIEHSTATVKFNDGTQAILPLDHIGKDSIAVKHREFIRKEKINNPYPYEVLDIHIGNYERR